MSEMITESSGVKDDGLDDEFRSHVTRRRAARKETFRRLFTPKFNIGVGIVLVVTLFGVIAPFFTQDPRAINAIGLSGPSDDHILGTSQVGQDIFAQLAHATRGSLIVGFAVGLLTLVLSAFFGIIGAYIGGVTDEAFSFITNVMLVIPGLPLVIVIASYLEGSSLFLVIIVLAVTSWAAGARVLRSQTLSVRTRDYVLAARVSGEKTWRIVCVEILPNLLPVMSSGFVFAVVGAILAEAGLSFIGIGATGALTWGTMLADANNGQALLFQAWWWFAPPGLLIAILGAAFSLINFSIDEVINPRLRTVSLAKLQKRAETCVSETRPLLTVTGMSVDYLGERTVHAVKDVSLTLGRGEILGLAGESGCGKSTFAYGINQLLAAPALITKGKVVFHDKSGEDTDVLSLQKKALRSHRWNKVSMVFQGAMNSLNPVISVRSQLGDVFKTHRPEMSRAQRTERSRELLELVGVDTNRLNSYAHELSGGMRQRVMIAMALALDPQLMIMDEPTTALDVVVQRDILGEIMRLRSELGFAVIFITHDLPMLLEISDRIAIMRAGEIVEIGTAEDIFFGAKDPYTRTLLRSFPSLTGTKGDFIRHGAALEEESVD